MLRIFAASGLKRELSNNLVASTGIEIEVEVEAEAEARRGEDAGS